MPYCTNCGAEYLENSKFCNKCGNALTTKINPTTIYESTEDTDIPYISNKFIWLYIFMPFIIISLPFVVDLFLQNNYYYGLQESAYTIFNIVNVIICWILLYIDYYVKKEFSAFNVNRRWIFFFPIVYLYKRAKALNHRMTYFIVELIFIAIQLILAVCFFLLLALMFV